MIELHYGLATDVGHVRTLNEDSALAEPPVFVVADGMGGHDGGEVASKIVVDGFAQAPVRDLDAESGAEVINRTLAECQQQIIDYGRAQDQGLNTWHSGTTVTLALVVEDGSDDPRWLLANVGDSRIYRMNEGRLDQVSVDHSVVQELIDAGRITREEASRHPDRHVITRALGTPGEVRPEFFLLPLASAERILLCSDGISGMVPDEQIEATLREVGDPRDAADRLVAEALAAGGEDNATAVVVDVVGYGKHDSPDPATQRLSLEEKLGALP